MEMTEALKRFSTLMNMAERKSQAEVAIERADARIQKVRLELACAEAARAEAVAHRVSVLDAQIASKVAMADIPQDMREEAARRIGGKINMRRAIIAALAEQKDDRKAGNPISAGLSQVLDAAREANIAVAIVGPAPAPAAAAAGNATAKKDA